MTVKDLNFHFLGQNFKIKIGSQVFPIQKQPEKARILCRLLGVSRLDEKELTGFKEAVTGYVGVSKFNSETIGGSMWIHSCQEFFQVFKHEEVPCVVSNA